MIRDYDTPVLMKGGWIFNPDGMSNRENLYGNMYEKLKVPDSFSLQNRNYDSAEKVCFGKNENIFRPQMPYNQFSELD